MCIYTYIHSIYTVYIHTAAAKSLQLCQTLCDPIDSSPPGSPVPGTLQAGTLEWVATSFSNLRHIHVCMYTSMSVPLTFNFKNFHPATLSQALPNSKRGAVMLSPRSYFTTCSDKTGALSPSEN